MKRFGLYKFATAVWLMLATTASSFAQQNVQFTQYIFNSLSVNPAYAGYKEEWFAQMALRNQWTGVQDAPKTGQVSIDGILDPVKKNMGLGLQITADQLGPQSLNSAYLNYAYRLRLNAEDTRRLTFGVGAGVTQYGLDYSKLDPIDMGDNALFTGNSSQLLPDVRFGTYYYSPRFYFGASVMDLLSDGNSNLAVGNSGNQNLLRLKKHLYIISGFLVDINPDIRLRPSFLVKEDFRGPTSLDLNSMVIFRDRIWVGASYRTGIKLWDKQYAQNSSVSATNSVSGVAQFYVNRELRIGYSYDYALSGMRDMQSGSHEITLGLTLPQKANRLLSPRFF